MFQTFENNDSAQKEFEKNKNGNDSKKEDGPDIFLIQKGVTQLRVIPTWKQGATWFREVFEHYIKSSGGNTLYTVCPSTFNRSCLICEEGKKLHSSREEEDVARSSSLRPTRKFLINAFIVSGPKGEGLDGGVRPVKIGTMVKKALISLDRDFTGGWGDMTSLEKGFDVRIERTGETMTDTQYFTLGVPQRTNIIEVLKSNGKDISSFAVNNLDEFLECPTDETLTHILNDDFVPGFPSVATVEVTPPAITVTATHITPNGEPNETVVTSTNPVAAPEVPEPFTTK